MMQPSPEREARSSSSPTDQIVEAMALALKAKLGEALNAKPLLGDVASGDWYSDGSSGSIDMEDMARACLSASPKVG